jgi:hypothetical protein
LRFLGEQLDERERHTADVRKQILLDEEAKRSNGNQSGNNF